MIRSLLLCLLCGACATPETVCGIRADYEGQCDGDGTVLLRYHFGSTLDAPLYGITRCWMTAEGVPMCRVDVTEPRARFSNGCELMELGHEVCHSMGGHHGR